MVNNQLQYRIDESYDDKGLLIDSITYNSDGEKEKEYNYFYDSHGYIVEELYDQTVYLESGNNYDENGNLIKRQFHWGFSEGEDVVEEYEYDSFGNVIAYRREDDDYSQSWEYKYEAIPLSEYNEKVANSVKGGNLGFAGLKYRELPMTW